MFARAGPAHTPIQLDGLRTLLTNCQTGGSSQTYYQQLLARYLQVDTRFKFALRQLCALADFSHRHAYPPPMTSAIRDEAIRAVGHASCPMRTTRRCRQSRQCRLRHAPATGRCRVLNGPKLGASTYSSARDGLTQCQTTTRYPCCRCDQLARVQHQDAGSSSCWHAGGERRAGHSHARRRREGATDLISRIAHADTFPTPRELLAPPPQSLACRYAGRACTSRLGRKAHRGPRYPAGLAVWSASGRRTPQ